MIPQPQEAERLLRRDFGGAGRELYSALQQGKERRVSRLLRLTAALALLLPVSFVVGWLTQWNGQSTRQLTFEEAMAVIVQDETWAKSNGAYQLQAKMRKALEGLATVARREDSSGRNAHGYLGHLAHLATKNLADLAAERPDILDDFRPLILKELER